MHRLMKLEPVVQEAGTKRWEDADPCRAAAASINRTDVFAPSKCILTEGARLRKCWHANVRETRHRCGWNSEAPKRSSTSQMPRLITHFLHGRRHAGLAKAAMLGSSAVIAEMAKLDRGRPLDQNGAFPTCERRRYGRSLIGTLRRVPASRLFPSYGWMPTRL